MEYGADQDYMSLMETARIGWIDWNERWQADGTGPLYHETGVLMITRDRMAPGGFEHDSYRLLTSRGHKPQRLDEVTISRNFPAWSTGTFVDGFFHRKGGYAESGKVVAALLRQGRAIGITIQEGHRVSKLLETAGKICGVSTDHGQSLEADAVVMAVGAWIGSSDLSPTTSIQATGHPVFHLRPLNPTLFEAKRFPTFTADVSRTGYYGFPVNFAGIVKIASHGIGIATGPDSEGRVHPTSKKSLHQFLAETIPALADAPIVSTRLCHYADTQDGNFWIASDPNRPGLTIAGGGSGHGFKFAPILGKLIADAVTGSENIDLKKFRWRPEIVLQKGTEAARCYRPETEE